MNNFEKEQMGVGEGDDGLTPTVPFQFPTDADEAALDAIFEEMEDVEEGKDVVNKRLLEALGVLADWVTHENKNIGGYNNDVNRAPRPPEKRLQAQALATRAFAMFWVLRPKLFGGVSLRELAEITGRGHSQLSSAASAFCEKFVVTDPALKQEAEERIEEEKAGGELDGHKESL
jgi:hypothetical protein